MLSPPRIADLCWLALRNVGRNRVRTALSLAAIAVGVAGLILSGGFVQDLIYQLGEALIRSQSGHIQLARSGYFDTGSRSPGKFLVEPADAARVPIDQLPHVDAAMRRVAFSGLVGNGRSSYPVLGEGIEPEAEARLGTRAVILEGRTLAAADRFGILVGAGVAKAMNLKPGSRINVIAPTVDEAMNTLDFEVVGIFQSFSKDYDDRAVKLPLAAAQTLIDTSSFNVLVLLLTDTAHTRTVAREIENRIDGSRLELRTWDVLNDFYWKTVALYDRQFGVLRLIVLVMVVLAIAGAVNIGVLERAAEFGTMRALGNTGRDVLRLVIAEGVVLGFLGAALGVLLGAGSALAISKVGIPMPPPPNSNLEFTARIALVPGVIVTSAAVGLLATILASLAPAVRVARLAIVDALRQTA